MYGIDLPKAQPILEKVANIKGRMEYVQKNPFAVVVDYAHTPESLIQVYQTLKSEILNPKSETNSKFKIQNSKRKLICVLGAAGGGRDKWKRPEFGKIASLYCDQIILTDEDPYDENPRTILEEVRSGISREKIQTTKEILDRKEGIKTAISMAEQGDVVVITGKGSETSMAVAGGKKIPWSDRDIVAELTDMG